jgi:hypothetical protein
MLNWSYAPTYTQWPLIIFFKRAPPLEIKTLGVIFLIAKNCSQTRNNSKGVDQNQSVKPPTEREGGLDELSHNEF